MGNERKQIAGWAKGDSLALGILIDDALDTTVASQWNDLRNFIMAQPANTAVAHASNRTAMTAQDFMRPQRRLCALRVVRSPPRALILRSSTG